jgi:hypothetical protein
LYLDRLPEAEKAYEMVRTLDPQATFISAKLGSMIMLEPQIPGNEKLQTERRQRANRLFSEASETYSRYINAWNSDPTNRTESQITNAAAAQPTNTVLSPVSQSK